MKTINHEYYVSLEVAKLLKEAGFNWKCKYAYIITPAGDMPTGEEGMLTEYVENVNWLVSAPTLAVAQKWLREVKRWEAQVAYGFDEDCHKTYVTECGNPEGDLENYIVYFPTYEEALEAAIKKCLELILKEEQK